MSSQTIDRKAVALAFASERQARIIYTEPDACGLRFPDGSHRKMTTSEMLAELRTGDQEGAEA